MDKVPVTIEGMKNLLYHAKKNGTVNIWIDVAIQWMERAQAELNRLTPEGGGMNKVIITKCVECAGWAPANSLGLGVYCDELQQIISETDTDALIPDICPKLISQRQIIHNLISTLIENAENLDPAFSKIVSKKFWDLI